ncbi:acyl-CoA dehydrogenase family protein [Streptomyces sp. HNM0663]|uniref:Acyl-CoA dehydrogenase family protein n=1 Tax=Streptomyces chengmaiensis TaxID=3040919 RepID=A0ABT6HH46_9ACTN|nr:acyl-CoA dehydrogenase family protein [Streptomyces chengmaiensis]MDH2387384.1 acyl-CoA dehydrogenase family protein [Streptomyces chengmaiensis]
MTDADIRRIRATPPGPFEGPGSHAIRRATKTAGRNAHKAQRERRLADDTIIALTNAGFARHFVPQRWGGAEGTFTEVFRAAVDVGEGCASAAWCAVLWAAHGRFAAQLPEEGQKELWGEVPDVRIAASLMPPSGSATRVSGGWTLQGEWDLASGVDHAHWVLLAAPETDEPGRPVRVFAVPRSLVTVRDTWNATGLRATGSNTVVLAATVVPDGRSVPLATLLAGGGAQGLPRCHAAPAHLVGGLMFCAPAVGAARRALAIWNRWARTATPGGVRPLDHGAVQERLARSAAEIEAAELMLRTAAERADAGAITEAATAANRRDAALAVDWLATAVDRLFRTGGAHLRDVQGELHRHWSDVLTAASHGALRLEPAAEAYARSLDADGDGDA